MIKLFLIPVLFEERVSAFMALFYAILEAVIKSLQRVIFTCSFPGASRAKQFSIYFGFKWKFTFADISSLAHVVIKRKFLEKKIDLRFFFSCGSQRGCIRPSVIWQARLFNLDIIFILEPVCQQVTDLGFVTLTGA